jgi:hypothetical protein
MEGEGDAGTGPFLGVVGSLVPDTDFTGAVLALGDLALEVAEGEVVIVNLDGEAFCARLFGDAFRHSPALEHPLFFQTKIEVVRAGIVFLNDELRHTHRILIAGGFRADPTRGVVLCVIAGGCNLIWADGLALTS